MDSIEGENKPKSKWWLWLIIFLIIAAGAYYYFIINKTSDSTPKTETKTATQSSDTSKSWKEAGVAISGQFADADVVDLGNGTFRMYYSVEPEVAGNKFEVYSATSKDGSTWTKEEGVRKTLATFPDVMKLADGKFRMYFQNAGVIKSAISNDGLSFTDEAGERINKDETGYNLENVGAQTTIKLDDGTYLMVYRGMINTPYKTSEKIPNSNTQIYFYANSPDGLTFTKKGLAIDSRNETLYGLADGAEFVNWDSSTSSGQAELRIYFWSYKGVYHTIYDNSSFSTPVFDFTNSSNSSTKFSENPPSDPTLAKINNVWHMFYGQHTKGIYYATLQ